MVRASASVTREKNAIHSLMEVDVTEPRKWIKTHFEKTGEKLSFTAYIVTCLAYTLRDHPRMNSFIKGNRLIILDDVTVNVLMEREVDGENVPESIGIKETQKKTFRGISQEIREMQRKRKGRMGDLSGMTWIKFIPGFLLKSFIRIADKNIKMAKKYGKVAVTAVGMFNKGGVWFIPHGTATILLTVGGINEKIEIIDKKQIRREYLNLTVTFDHDIVDGAPAARFMKQLTDTISEGNILNSE
jgi:pyruvate/2-oxoglutarate dehydrogenase complex dihydrolipoamide acyltransferase (E2) component